MFDLAMIDPWQQLTVIFNTILAAILGSIIDFDFSESVSSDELGDTADYVMLHNIVRKEMAIRSKLIEHVAGRILNSVKEYLPEARAIKVLLTKYNPPVNGRIGKAVVEVGYNKS